jgi:NDP-sugar pyrophosphorylase family protein
MATFLNETRPDVRPGPNMNRRSKSERPEGLPAEPAGREASAFGLMFTGIHVIQPSFIDRVPPEGEQCIVRTAYRQLFHEPRGIDVHVHEGYWWEHSTVERYLQGIANVLDGRARLDWAERPVIGVDPSAIIEPGVELDARVLVGPGARIGAGTRLGPHVEVGAGASVGPGLRLERAAVWPGAVLDHDLVDGVCV